MKKDNNKQTLFDIQWNEKYKLLIDFKNEYKHCNVPDKTTYKGCELGRWVTRQRARKTKLSPDRITKLNSINFVWNIFEFVWMKNYKDLKNYKNKFGHCNVSKGNERYLSLANWVIKQRQYFKKGKLSKKQIKNLENIGFTWEKYKRTPWCENLQKLETFKAKFGHCNVTKSYKDKPLGNWVSIQRRDKHKLSIEQIKKLDKLEFNWILKSGRKHLNI
nr:helicase associated domain-containing protein [uncultured Marinifilum sp.]